MKRRAALVVAFLGVGCAYYNSLYNANRAFAEAEAARREGREAVAQAKYGEAIEKAAKSYRSSEDGRWSDDALYLIGRSHARRGDWEEATAALQAALASTDDGSLAAGARVYLGASAVSLGDGEEGMALLDSALAVLDDDELRAEAFLWRARARYRVGAAEPVWSDLDSAAIGGERYQVEAALDRLSWGVETRTLDQAALGAGELLARSRAAAASDTIERLMNTSMNRWGGAATLPLLAGAEHAAWPPGRRDGLLLLRSRAAFEAGDALAAEADAQRVASGVGAQADAGRVLLARWRMHAMEDPAELDEIRAMLLPAVGSSEALQLLDGIKMVALLVERSQREGQALALFAAAEMARDELDAPGIARTLFLAYSDLDPGAAWEGKALLAALDTTDDLAARRDIQERIDQIPLNTYVVAARWDLGDRQPEYTVVERRLEGVLQTIRAQVTAQAAARDVIVSQAAQALDSLRATEAIARRLAAGDSTVLDSIRADSARLDSIRRDSIGGDSVRSLDSLFADTLRLDTLPPGTPHPRPRPILIPLRDAAPDRDPRGTPGVVPRQ